MDTRNVDELIAEAQKIADAKNKPTSNSSNNDDDERVLVLDHPKTKKDKDDRDDRWFVFPKCLAMLYKILKQWFFCKPMLRPSTHLTVWIEYARNRF